VELGRQSVNGQPFGEPAERESWLHNYPATSSNLSDDRCYASHVSQWRRYFQLRIDKYLLDRVVKSPFDIAIRAIYPRKLFRASLRRPSAIALDELEIETRDHGSTKREGSDIKATRRESKARVRSFVRSGRFDRRITPTDPGIRPGNVHLKSAQTRLVTRRMTPRVLASESQKNANYMRGLIRILMANRLHGLRKREL